MIDHQKCKENFKIRGVLIAGRMERDEINMRRQRSLLWLCRCSLAVFVSVLFLSEPITPPRALGQTSPASGGSSSTLSGEKDIRPLEEGKPIERQLARGEAHSYQVTVQANQYLHVVVEQRGIDVVVTLFAPDGKALVRSDNPNGAHGPEPVSLIAETSGSYRLEVRPFSSDSVPGRYWVKIGGGSDSGAGVSFGRSWHPRQTWQSLRCFESSSTGDRLLQLGARTVAGVGRSHWGSWHTLQ